MFKNIETAGLTGFCLERSGNDTPMLFVHGMWGGVWYFRDWMTYASKHTSVYAFNLRGHHDSLSDLNVGNVSIFDYIEDVIRMLRKIGRPTILVGHSMGGLICQAVAAREKELVKGLVMVCSAPPRGIFIRGGVVWRMMRSRYMRAILCNKPLALRFEDAYALMLNNVSDSRDAFGNFVSESGRAAREIILGCINISAKEITCPKMILAGTADRMIPLGAQEALRKKYSPKTCRKYSGGHFPMIESNWEMQIQDILEFAKTC